MQFSNGFLIDFIKLAGPFWCSARKNTIIGLTLGLFVLTVLQIGVAVEITEWSADLFNALEQRSMSGLWVQIGIVILIFAANIVVSTSHFKVKRRIQLEWRNWLTDHMLDRWMTGGRHYLVTHIQGRHDNPDGRIAEDIRISTEFALDLIHSLTYSLLLLISFTKILWTLSGTVVMDFWLFTLPIKGHLVWIALIYAAGASVLGWWIGRPLTKATDYRQTVEANFRFGLVTARENSLAIALVHGEQSEQKRLTGLFGDIIAAWNHQTEAWSRIFIFTSGYSVLSMAFPILVSAPRFILGAISLGALMQSAQAFQQMAAALSWPVDNMARVAEWRASVERVLGLANGLQLLETEISRSDPHRIKLVQTEEHALVFNDLCVSRLDGLVCVSVLNDSIVAGEHILIAGNSFTGSKLFKSIVGLWPWGSGSINLPRDAVFFMPPLPYLPNGKLKAAICYPLVFESCDLQRFEQILEEVGLQELIEHLDEEGHWATDLSREHQQRLGVARLLIHAPQWVLIQEALDSLDADTEMYLWRLICQHLPKATILTISKEPKIAALHKRQIVL